MKKVIRKKKISLNQKIRERLVPIAVMMIVVLGTVLFGGRLLDSLRQQQQVKKSLQGKIVVLTGKLEFLEEINQAAIESQVNDLESILPSRKPALNLLASLSQLSQAEGVMISSITLNPGPVGEAEEEDDEIERKEQEDNPPLQEFTLDFSVDGTLRQVGLFITALEKTAPAMKIEEFSLSLKSSPLDELAEQVESRKVKMSLKVRVFYQDLPASLGPADQALPELTAEEVALLSVLNSYVVYEPVQPSAPVGKDNLFSPALIR